MLNVHENVRGIFHVRFLSFIIVKINSFKSVILLKNFNSLLELLNFSSWWYLKYFFKIGKKVSSLFLRKGLSLSLINSILLFSLLLIFDHIPWSPVFFFKIGIIFFFVKKHRRLKYLDSNFQVGIETCEV